MRTEAKIRDGKAGEAGDQEGLKRLCVRAGGGGLGTERGTRILGNIHSERALEVLAESGGREFWFDIKQTWV